jgi:hypothetical protein
MAGPSSGVVRVAAAGWRQWQCQGIGGGASVDVGGDGSGGTGGTSGSACRGGAAVLALLGSHRVRVADALARAAC